MNKHWGSVKAQVGQEYYLSIIIPAYNEEERIIPTLNEIVDYLKGFDKKTEVVVVDDGSTDKTVEIVGNYIKDHDYIKLHKQPRNMGKGAAVKRGMLESRGKYSVFADADGSTPIKEVERLLEAAEDGVQVVIGSRALFSTNTNIETVWYRKLLGRCFNFFVNLFILPGIKDTQCGFKLFSAKATHTLFDLQTAEGFSFDLEILFLTKKLGFSFREVAINWTNVPGSKVNLALDAARMFKDIFYFRWLHRKVKT